MSDASEPEDKTVWLPENAVAADYSRRSNLALAFLSLPRDKRADMDVFYTFCRLVDDIADSPALPPEEKEAYLQAWRLALGELGAVVGSAKVRLIDQIHALIAKYHIPAAHFLEIIAGVEMDIHSRHYATFDQLRGYCYRVASVVGLVSIEIFGYQDERCRKYAVDLGLALQLTNIIRDVGTDLDNGGRIYLPLEDLERFGYAPADLRARAYDRRFRALMDFEARRAEGFYRDALANLPAVDRRAMSAAEVMRAVYWRILQKIRRGRFQVFDRRHRLNALEKMLTLLVTAAQSRWG